MELPLIREITGDNGLQDSAGVIRKSFEPVAAEFGLTEQNCSTHPSFVTVEHLQGLKERRVRLFGLFLGELQAGFVAVEKADDNVYYMEKLAVLPEYRHQGYGGKLTAFVLDYIRGEKGRILSIGIINKHTVLKDWYADMGFKETGIKRFSHLPFDVCFMEIDLRV